MSLTRRQFLRRLPPLTAAGLAGCQRREREPLYNYELPEVPLQVTATTPQLADMAMEIGGEAVTASSLMPRGKNPHVWEMDAADVAALRLADVALLNGLGLEKELDAELEGLEKAGVSVVSAGAALPQERVIYPAGAEGPPDPHFWMSFPLWAEATAAVEQALKDAFPPAAKYFAARAHAYRVELEKLHAWAVKLFQELPENRRRFFTTRATFAYFAREYDLEWRALRGAADPLPEELSPVLKEWLEENRVKTLFREADDDVPALTEICRPAGVRVEHQVFSLSLAPEGQKMLGSFAEMEVGRLTGALRYTIDTIQGHLVL